MVYTAETSGFKTLTHAMRTPKTGKLLAKLLDFIHGLQAASRNLPVHKGMVFRGLGTLVNPNSYRVNEVVCWQAFSSSTKSLQQTLKFLRITGVKLDGTLIIIVSKNG